MKKNVFSISLLFLYLFFPLSLDAIVGPVVPGESLWCIEKRIGSTVDIIESKVCNLEHQFSLIEQPLCSLLTILSSEIDILDSFSELINVDLLLIESKLCVSSSRFDLIDSLLPAISSKLADLFPCQAIVITSPTTITTAGFYCLANDITGPLVVQADDVVVSLNGHRVTGNVTIMNNNQVTIMDGIVDANGSGDAISVQSGASSITLEDVMAENGTRGIFFDAVSEGIVSHCEMSHNTTGLEFNVSNNIVVNYSTAADNVHAGFSLVSSSTNSFSDCKALNTGHDNALIINNTVIGFSSINGSGNIFERCIANATQALSTTDSNSIIAGFALRGDEMCSKIIDSEAANATTAAGGVTVPYGILLEGTLTTLTSVTVVDPGGIGAADTVRATDWSPDGIYLAVGGVIYGTSNNDLIIYRFDRATGSLTVITSAAFQGAYQAVNAVNWSPDGMYLAVGGQFYTYGSSSEINDLMVYRFDKTSGSLTLITSVSFGSTGGAFLTVDWSPDGRFLAAGGVVIGGGYNDDLYVFRFNSVTETLTQVDSVSPDVSGNGTIFSVDWSPDGQYLAVGASTPSNDLFIYKFDRGAGILDLVASINPGEGAGGDVVVSVRWSPDGQYLAVGGNIYGPPDTNMIIYRFDRDTGSAIQVVAESPGGSGTVQGIDWSPDGNYLAVGGDFGGGDLFVYRFDRGANLLNQVVQVNLEGVPADEVNAVQWSPDGQYLAVGGEISGVDLIIYRAIQFPVDNVIKNNTVYCNSGAQFPSGVGISGSSICNLIIQNTAYSNPTNPTIVPSNYEFVCNVFNQLFGVGPSLMQNIALGTCEPIATPDNVALLLLQARAKGVALESILASISSKISNFSGTTTCAPTSITSPTTINTAGEYCLANDITGPILINADDVSVDLNGHRVTGTVTIAGKDQVSVSGGVVDASGASNAIDVQAGSTAFTLDRVLVRNAIRGINVDRVESGLINHCEMIQNTTGVEFNLSNQIVVQDSVARANVHAGFSLISSSTNVFSDCQALGTGEGNQLITNNTVVGFSSLNGAGNIFERCIANSTQALSTTDANSIVAGFALRGDEMCSKIIDSEAANATTAAGGVTVPYGILLEGTLTSLTTVTGFSPGGASDIVLSLDWSSDGIYLAVGGTFDIALFGDLIIYKFDRSLGSLTAITWDFSGGYHVVDTAKWSPDGNYLAVGGLLYSSAAAGLIVYRFDRTVGSLTKVADVGFTGNLDEVFTVDWSPNGQYLAAGGRMNEAIGDDLIIYRFDSVAQTLTQVTSVSPGGAGDDDILSVNWSPDGQYLAVGADVDTGSTNDLFIYRFDRGTQTLALVVSRNPGIADPNDAVRSVNWSPDGQYLAIGGDINGPPNDDVIIYRFDRGAGSLIQVASIDFSTVITSNVRSVNWSPNGQYLAVGGVLADGNDLRVYAFDRGAGLLTEVASAGDGTDDLWAVRWSPDGQYLAAGGSTSMPLELVIYRAIQFPVDNVIKNNVVYCNSGAQFPSGVGISGSSICNYIIGNTAYSNPTNPTIVSTNYAFVCNVFNQLFGVGPSLMQNIALGSCEPIATPENVALLLKQAQATEIVNTSALAIIQTVIDDATSKLNLLVSCQPTPITTPTTINVSGAYCLANNITGSILINADDVVVDLNNHLVTGTVTVAGRDQVTVRNGVVVGPSNGNGIDVQTGSSHVALEAVTVKSALRGVLMTNATNSHVSACELVQNTTGIELLRSHNVLIENSIARANKQSGFSLVTSFTNNIIDCQALGTGEGNTTIANNLVFGFVSNGGTNNIFERCIANSTQALSTTDFNSIVAGFALRDGEMCSKIINSEAANASASASGVTVPYGVWLEGIIDPNLTSTATPAMPTAVEPRSISWSPDGIYCATTGLNGVINVYQFDRANYTLNRVATVSRGVQLFNISWSPDGEYLASSNFTGTGQAFICKFDRTNNSLQVVSLSAATTSSRVVRWSSDNNFLAVVSQNASSQLQLFSFNRVSEQLILLQTITPQAQGCFSLAWRPDGRYLAVGDINTLWIYVLQNNSLTLVTSATSTPSATFRSLDWSPDGKYLAAGRGNGFLNVFRFDGVTLSLQPVVAVNGTNDNVTGVSWSSDARFVAAGDQVGAIRVFLFDRATPVLTPVASRVTPTSATNEVFFSPDGRFLIESLSAGTPSVQLLQALSFPSDNVIKNNTVYCNSSPQSSGPTGIGISGSSICNYIVGNTAYSNPTNPTIVSTNYAFVTNVFNPLFGIGPSLMQNISLGSCSPVPTPENVALLLKQAQADAGQLISRLDVLESLAESVLANIDLSGPCAATPVRVATTISTSGYYCLANNVAGTISIEADDVTFDLNGHKVTGSVVIAGRDQVTVENGTVEGTGSGNAIDVQSGARNITISSVLARNATCGINFSSTIGGLVSYCELSQNTTGIELDSSRKVEISNSIARSNTHAGFSLLSSSTNYIHDCNAFNTGESNATVINNAVFGYVSQNGAGNIFERCIANSTLGLSTTDANSLIAGFALRGDETCTKIINSESTGAVTSASGVTVPYGILLEGTLTSLVSVTVVNPGGGDEDSIVSVNWSPDGVYLAIGGSINYYSSSNDLRLYKFDRTVGSLTEIASVTIAGVTFVRTVNWSPDGMYLAVGADNSNVLVYSFDRWAESLTLLLSVNAGGPSTFFDFIYSVNWSPDGQYLAVGGAVNYGGTGDDVIVYKFNAVAQTLSSVASVNPGGASDDVVYSVNWSPDGQYLAVGGAIDSYPPTGNAVIVYRFDRSTETLTQVVSVDPEGTGTDTVRSARWSPDGQYLAVGGNITGSPTNNDLIIYRFNRAAGSLIPVVSVSPGGAGTDTVYTLSWSPDGQYLAVGGILTNDDLIIYRFDRGAGLLTQILVINPEGGISDNVYAVNWSPDGAYLAVGGDISGIDLIIYRAIQFPVDNVIMNNTVYCNSGAQFPSGVGIIGSSICNYIIGNTAYSNPINPTIVSSNYQFACNVFQQDNGVGPTGMQNISLGTCEPIQLPDNVAAILNQALSELTGLAVCAPISLNQSTIGSATTLTIGNYCLAEDVIADITLQSTDPDASVLLDLSGHCLNGTVTINNTSLFTYATLKNGIVRPPTPTAAPAAAVTISAGSTRGVLLQNLSILCDDTTIAGVDGRSGISLAAGFTRIADCFIKAGSVVAPASNPARVGGDGIVITGNRTFISNCTIITGTGGDASSGAGGRAGHGIYVQPSAYITQVTGCTIFQTGSGGAGSAAAGGQGGDGINIESGAAGTAVISCNIHNTGAGGNGTPAGAGGKAVNDMVTTSTLSVIFKNFAHNIANSTKFDIQSMGEAGVLTPNPPTGTMTNPFANFYAS